MYNNNNNIMKICVVTFIIYYLNGISLALRWSNLLNENKLLKLSKVFNAKRDNEIILNFDEYEYPRSNNSLRHIHELQWLDYYKCLEEIYADVLHDRIIYPNALTTLEGTSVTFKCQVCISPMETHGSPLITWYFNSSKSCGIKSVLQYTDHIINSPDNRYITIYSVKLEQAGIYWCEVGDTVGSIYYLYVDNDLETIVVHSNKATLVENVPEYKIKIYTSWTTWSPCSMCDMVGIKLRYGYCTVSLIEMPEHKYVVNNPTVNALQHHKKRDDDLNQAHKDTIMTNTTLNVQLQMALMLFKNKLPCKSRLLPEQVRSLLVVKKKKTAIMRRYCKKTCQKNIIFEVRDEKGNVLESANNSAGIFSMVQGMPELLPSIARNVLYEKYDKRFKLVCPGNLNTDIPIVWRINDKVIVPSHIKSQSNGRIHVNPQMQILFESLKFEDANIYSCWQNDQVAGIVKLNVIGETEFKLNHRVILVGASIIISVVLMIFWKAFKGRTRYTMH